MDDDEKEIALLYAKGEYIEYATGRQFALVVRENEFCVLRYYIGSQFTVSWLPEYFPSPDTLAFILMAVNSLLVIIILTARFAKNLRTHCLLYTSMTQTMCGDMFLNACSFGAFTKKLNDTIFCKIIPCP